MWGLRKHAVLNNRQILRQLTVASCMSLNTTAAPPIFHKARSKHSAFTVNRCRCFVGETVYHTCVLKGVRALELDGGQDKVVRRRLPGASAANERLAYSGTRT
jgi:hypothetical protein